MQLWRRRKQKGDRQCRSPTRVGLRIANFVAIRNLFSHESLFSGLCLWGHRYETILVAFALEAYDSVSSRKKSVVAAKAYIGAWMKLGAALTHDNAAGIDRLTAKHFHAEALALRVAAVAG